MLEFNRPRHAVWYFSLVSTRCFRLEQHAACCRPWFTYCANSYWDVLRHFFHQPLYRDYHSMLPRFCVTGLTSSSVQFTNGSIFVGPQRPGKTALDMLVWTHAFAAISRHSQPAALGHIVAPLRELAHITHICIPFVGRSLGCNTHRPQCARNQNVLSGWKDLLRTRSPTMDNLPEFISRVKPAEIHPSHAHMRSTSLTESCSCATCRPSQNH